MPKPNCTIGVVCGGPSPEADVSRLTAARVSSALEKHYSKVVLLELDETLPETLKQHRIDVVFPATPGPLGEDGCLQGLLDIMGIPYVGSGVLGSACSLNKLTTKRILQAYDIPLAKDVVVDAIQPLQQQVEQCIKTLGEKVIIKPLAQGSGIGVQFAEGHQALEAALKEGLLIETLFLVEEFISGREITAGVLDLETPISLPVIEIKTPDSAWYDYVHRYTPGLSEHIIPASLPEKQYKRVQEIALKAHQALHCRDMSRSDFIVPESGEPIFAELNNLPGMTPTSLYPDGARHMGIDFETLMCKFIDHALERSQLESVQEKKEWEIPSLRSKSTTK